jgi:wyosine [tRNA(Phe)-imidazoG37] synthetase (radical SAM superfamily)
VQIAFGPVPSRRLGRSLGINNVPPKHCTYACVYCQLGRTPYMHVDRRAFYPVDRISEAVRQRLQALEQDSQRAPDYATFVPDGETTLDANLSEAIATVKALGVPTAVITNGSLLDDPDVRDALRQADWVSIKVDAADDAVWRAVDRPHGKLSLDAIREGARAFAASYSGILATETMLVRGVNDEAQEIEAIADWLAVLQPAIAYVAIPTRPPAESWVNPPKEEALHAAYQILASRLPRVEWLIGYEGNAFASTGDTAQDLLQITAVHPMREDAVRELLTRNGQDWSVVEGMVLSGAILALSYGGQRYYVRALARRG